MATVPISKERMIQLDQVRPSGKSTLLNRIGALEPVVAHDMHVAKSCDRTIGLGDGRIAAHLRGPLRVARSS
jgi:ABC-type lipoprotein export system ATPase subunit